MLANIRHERFAQAIARGRAASTAYIEAGYAARGRSAEVASSRLLRNVEVAARLEELAAKLETASIADAEEIQRFFTSVMRGQLPDGTVLTEDHVTKDGVTVEVRVAFKDRVKAGELLGRARGLFSSTGADAEGELLAIAQALANPVGGRAPPN
ncbi:MAG: terminase small subunit [Gemmatimonadaceae bacterium]|nr:terminase small subunit [Gemmatimonadaceae bacterium]